MNPETIKVMTAGATPVQIVILFCVGGIFIWGLFSMVRWLIQIKTKHLESLPQDIKEIKEKLNENGLSLCAMNSKLWSEEKIKSEFDGALEHHQNQCPAWRYHCNNNNNRKD